MKKLLLPISNRQNQKRTLELTPALLQEARLAIEKALSQVLNDDIVLTPELINGIRQALQNQAGCINTTDINEYRVALGFSLLDMHKLKRGF